MDDALPEAGEGGPIRVLWLIDSLTAGGAEALTVPFARALAPRPGEGGSRRGVELEMAYLRSLGGNPFEAELRELGVPVTGLGARNLRDVAAFRRLLALVRDRRIDLVHAHLAYASIWGTAAGRRLGRPTVVSLHVRPPADPLWSREGARRRLRVALANRWASRVVSVSAAVRDAWVEGAGLAPGKVVVVHNGVEAPGLPANGSVRARVRAELRVPEGAPLVVTVSVLRPGKGIEVLLEAAPAVLARVPAACFVVVGDGPARTALEGRAAASPPVAGAFRWTGFRRDVPALLAAADLFVLPSLDDAFPTVLLEAMAAGLPVVATEAGGIPEIVADGTTGMLVPPGDPDHLGAAVAALLVEPEARAVLGTGGRRRWEERFTTAAWLERLGRLYGEVLGRPVRLAGEAQR